MGAFTSRRRGGVEEVEISGSVAYRYPPKSGTSVLLYTVMTFMALNLHQMAQADSIKGATTKNQDKKKSLSRDTEGIKLSEERDTSVETPLKHGLRGGGDVPSVFLKTVLQFFLVPGVSTTETIKEYNKTKDGKAFVMR